MKKSTHIIFEFKLQVNTFNYQEILMKADLETHNTMKKAVSLKGCPQVSYLWWMVCKLI